MKLARENPELSSSCDVLLHIIILVSNWSVDNDSAAQVLDHRLNMVYKKYALLGQAGYWLWEYHTCYYGLKDD